MKKRLITILTALTVAVTACCVGMFLSLHSNAADDSAVRIMAVGDSITDGYINGDNGYRKYFCYEMQQLGKTDFDMVGPKNDWTNSATYDWNGTTITYDPQHAGYSGYAIQSTGGRSGIMETIFNNTYSCNATGKSGNMVEAYQPDIIMLQIGTNDILDCQIDGIETRLEELVDKLLPYVQGEGQMLFLASIPIIDVEVRNDWLSNYQWTLGIPSYSEDPEGYTQAVENAIASYNEIVKSLVAKKQAAGAHIAFSDINSVVDMKTGLYDGVHPNEEGYACMGKHWANVISNYMDSGIPAVSTTSDTTETTSVTSTTSTTESSKETTSVSSESQTETTASSAAESTATSSENTTETSSSETTTNQNNTLIGDINLDEQIALTDAVTMLKYLLHEQSISKEAFLRGDMNADGKVNGIDLALLRQMLLTENAK